ncbi:MAG: phosphatidylinositol phosphate synthase [Pseudonocardiales bacterium]
MLNVLARARVSRVLDPLGARLAGTGLSADAVTVIGTTGAVTAAVGCFPRGWFLPGTLIIWFFVMFDMLDGAVARARGTASRWGAFLDSTLDRVADAAVFGTLVWWFAFRGDSPPLALAALLCLVLGTLTSYVKARAEGLGMTCNVGFAERTERLIIILVGTGLAGLGVPYALAVALWLLAGASLITVVQRLAEVRRQAGAPTAPTAPAEGAG